MSAELRSVREPSGSHAAPQGTTVGGSKPLHRFLKGQPKIIGTVVVILGASFLIVTVATMTDLQHLRIWAFIPTTFILAVLFIAGGILYIVTEHNPTKKTVTISLAVSILCVLWAAWMNLHTLHQIGHYHSYMNDEVYLDETLNTTEWHESPPQSGMMLTAFEAVLMFYSFAGAIIFIVMSVLACTALRSTKSQAIVVMTTMSTETPPEEQP